MLYDVEVITQALLLYPCDDQKEDSCNAQPHYHRNCSNPAVNLFSATIKSDKTNVPRAVTCQGQWDALTSAWSYCVHRHNILEY